ncbi:MAG: sigma 54-interacting transcriptional regulator [bacterium]
MCKLFPIIQSVAPTNKTVLIVGEIGTKKGEIARIIHESSRRKYGRFVSVDLSSFQRDVLEVELFGHEHGNLFNPIVQKIGKIEQANGGSIYFNEIGEMPLPIQARLLYLIQNKRIHRVGGTSVVPVDVRIIASTSKNLELLVKENKFRADLFYRIDAFRIFVPPLRKCREDIPFLALHILKNVSRKKGKLITNISEKALEILCDYDWPENIDELKSVIENAVMLEETNTLQAINLPLRLYSDKERSNSSFSKSVCVNSDITPLDEIEKQALIHALKVTGNNIQQTAKALGINRATVYRKLEKYNLIEKTK